jgi:hypothetical protein
MFQFTFLKHATTNEIENVAHMAATSASRASHIATLSTAGRYAVDRTDPRAKIAPPTAAAKYCPALTWIQ